MKVDYVKSWMSAPPITISPDTPLTEAIELLFRHKVRRLPVVDEGNQLVGIITDRDIREAGLPNRFEYVNDALVHEHLTTKAVAEYMTERPVTVTPDTIIGIAANLMLKNKIGGLPVVKNGELVGVITESDVFEMVVKREWASF